MADKKTILVTGGGGYIGSHCVISLLEAGYDVVVFDNFRNCVGDGKPMSLVKIEELTGKTVKFHNVEMRNFEAVRKPFEEHKFDGVVHLAALKCVPESVADPILYYETNVMGTLNLIKVMTEFGVFNFIFSSSSTVYGNPEYLPIDEKHKTGGCTNPYGKTKHMSEEILRDLAESNKEWGIVFLRYFNPIGNHPSGEIGEDPRGVPNNLLPYLSQVAVGRRKKLTVFGTDYPTPDGSGDRDYIHVMDLADGHAASLDLLFKKGFKGVKAYNLSMNKGVSVLEIIDSFERASGLKIPTEFAPRRAGDIAASYASSELIEKELGWKCQYGIDDMCKHTWIWQSKNPNGYLDKKQQ